METEQLKVGDWVRITNDIKPFNNAVGVISDYEPPVTHQSLLNSPLPYEIKLKGEQSSWTPDGTINVAECNITKLTDEEKVLWILAH